MSIAMGAVLHLGYSALFGALLNWQSAHQPHLKSLVTPGVTWLLPCPQKVVSPSPQSCSGSSWRVWNKGWGVSSMVTRGICLSWDGGWVILLIFLRAQLLMQSAPLGATLKSLQNYTTEIQNYLQTKIWPRPVKPSLSQLRRLFITLIQNQYHAMWTWITQCQWGKNCVLWTQQT